jgi:hypothetical protein
VSFKNSLDGVLSSLFSSTNFNVSDCLRHF